MLGLAVSLQAVAQDTTLTKEQVLSMSMDDLSTLSLEDLMYAVELLDVKNVDELFSLIMNRSVSSASKKAEDSFKSPLSTSVITREEMRTYGCTSIEEALRMLPGVIAREKTNGNYDLHLRGLDNIPDGNVFVYTENTNTLVMVDGRPVFNYATGAMMWETLPVGIEEIERIEVVRGACGALYGSNAVTGVINIITEKPNTESKFVSGAVQAGSQNTYVGDVAIRKAFGSKLAMSLSGNFQMRNRPTSDIYLMPDGVVKFVDSRDPDRDFSEGAYLSTVDMQYITAYSTLDDSYGALSENSASVEERFANSYIARNSLALNYMLAFNPTSDIHFNFSTGYQKSLIMTSPVRSDYFSLSRRESKQFYADLAADVKGVSLKVSWTSGPQDFEKGAPSFKAINRQFTADLDYDWEVTDNMTIRPGVNYRWNQMNDEDYSNIEVENYLGTTQRISSYFNGPVSLTALAPSLRLDWSPVEPLRVVAAYRAEKMSCPDKWYHSYQAALTYSLNDDNNLRLIASRANRSAIFLNSSSNYSWDRTGMTSPDVFNLVGNPDAKVMSADNFEVGYRWRPAKNLMIDIEGYYNFSRDYGEIMSYRGEIILKQDVLAQALATMSSVSSIADLLAVNDEITDYITENLHFSNTLCCLNLPFKVRSRGISLSADWILCKQLVAKINLNVQKTSINNYYRYDQYGDIFAQLTSAGDAVTNCLTEVGTMFVSGNTSSLLSALTTTFDTETASSFEAKYAAAADQSKYLSDLVESGDLAQYFYLKYGVRYDSDKGIYYIGASSANLGRDTEDKHVSKSTPTFYGSVGLIYKPFEQLSVAANTYFYSKQEATIVYDSRTIASKCIVNLKVGYHPTDQFEVFFNAHNLLNDKKREFLDADENGGIYSFGVNFAF